MVDCVLRNPGGDDNRRNPRSILLEGKTILVMTVCERRVSRRNSCWRNRMIEKASVLVPGNDENAALPNRRVANGLIGRFDQAFTEPHVIQRMLRCAALVVV